MGPKLYAKNYDGALYENDGQGAGNTTGTT
jgi:hypothetical protein